MTQLLIYSGFSNGTLMVPLRDSVYVVLLAIHWKLGAFLCSSKI